MAEELFSNLNPIANTLEVLEGKSASDLKEQLKAFRLPVKVISIYAQGSRHYAWVLSEQKIKRVKKEKE